MSDLPAPTPFGTARRRLFSGMNAAVIPLWMTMILMPRSRVTRTLVRRAVPVHAGMSVCYAALLASGAVRSRALLDVRDPEHLRRQIGERDTFLAAWSHYLTFDLLVGQSIWKDALEHGRSSRASLLLTWLAGPIGHDVYLLQRSGS